MLLAPNHLRTSAPADEVPISADVLGKPFQIDVTGSEAPGFEHVGRQSNAPIPSAMSLLSVSMVTG